MDTMDQDEKILSDDFVELWVEGGWKAVTIAELELFHLTQDSWNMMSEVEKSAFWNKLLIHRDLPREAFDKVPAVEMQEVEYVWANSPVLAEKSAWERIAIALESIAETYKKSQIKMSGLPPLPEL